MDHDDPLEKAADLANAITEAALELMDGFNWSRFDLDTLLDEVEAR